ncbi:MAG: hypothetical protein HRU38_15505 [Saccharospirillaceae bacterium]|nr:hypothetical protein [Pseudomonadales bacterium]NRB80047.1 hypothetical protein [Saccharospirillaceae bacterium]
MKNILLLFCLVYSQYNFATNKETLVFSNYQEIYFLNEDIPELLQKAFFDAGFNLEYEDYTIETGFNKANSQELDGVILGAIIEGGRIYEDFLLPIPVTLVTQDFFAFFRSDLICPDSINQLSNYIFLKYKPAIIINSYMDLHYGSEFIVANNVLESLNIIKKIDTIDYLLLNKSALRYMSDLAGTYIKPCFNRPILQMQFQPLIHKKHKDKIPALTKSLQYFFNEYKNN